MIASEATDQFGQRQIGDHRQVRRGVAGIDSAQRARSSTATSAGGGQQIGRGQARDAAADHHDVGTRVVLEPRERGQGRRVDPIRSRIKLTGHLLVLFLHTLFRRSRAA